jgi:hypothetical protein
MKMGQYTVDQAVKEALQLTLEIDKHTETLNAQVAENRKQSATATSGNYKLQHQRDQNAEMEHSGREKEDGGRRKWCLT